jgi:DNA-binding winged helix-turn-helix (wHTH) protein
VSSDQRNEIYVFEGFRLDARRRVLSRSDGETIPLGPRVLDVLLRLVERRGELLDKRTLLETVWPSVVVEDNSLNQAISALRRALGERPGEHRFISTEPGRGYRFVAQVDVAERGEETRDPPESEQATSEALTRTRLSAPRARATPWLAIAALAAGAVLTLATQRALEGLHAPAGTVQRPVRLSADVTADIRATAAGAPRSDLAISPDGSSIAFSAGPLYVRSLTGWAAERLPTGPLTVQPFFSPDGQWVAYFEPGGGLEKVRIGGGDPITVVESVRNAFWAFGVWRADGTIVYSNEDTSLFVVSAEGGIPRPLAESAAPARPRLGPVAVASDTGALLFSTVPKLDGESVPRIESFDPQSGRSEVVIEDALLVAFTAGHRLIYGRGQDQELVAAYYDLASGRLGPAASIPEDGARDGGGIVPQLAVAQNGTLVYLARSMQEPPRAELGWVDRSGTFSRIADLPMTTRGGLSLDLSPDDRSVLLVLVENLITSRSLLVDTSSGIATGLKLRTRSAHWDSQGLNVVLGGAAGLRLWNSETAQARPLVEGITDALGVSPGSPGGFVYVAMRPDRNIYALDVETARERPLFADEAVRTDPAVSPDGTWIAYVTRDPEPQGRPNVRVARLADGRFQRALTAEGGVAPQWRSDGKELYFAAVVPGSRRLEMRATPVLSAPGDERLILGEPQPLFAVDDFVIEGDNAPFYDVTADGQRFVMVRRQRHQHQQPEPGELRVVLNWLDELNALTPTVDE